MTMLLFARRVVASSWTVSPTSSVSLNGDTVTLAMGSGGGGITLIVDTPVLLPLVAEMTALPIEAAVTRPDEDTEATFVADDDQVTANPDSRTPSASFTAALSCTVSPTSRDAVDGVTSMRSMSGPGSDDPPHDIRLSASTACTASATAFAEPVRRM